MITFTGYGDKSSAKRGLGRAGHVYEGEQDPYFTQVDGKWGFYKNEEGLVRVADAAFEDAPEPAVPEAKRDPELDTAIEKGIREGEQDEDDDSAPERPSALGAFAFAQLTAPSNNVATQQPAAETKAPEAAAAARIGIEKNRAEQNGVKRPSAGTLCARVWDLSQTMTDKLGKTVALGDLIETAEAQGINKFTARTQYARWRAFKGIVGKQK